MDYRFDVVEVPVTTLAVCQAFTRRTEIPSRMAEMFGAVYAWLRNSPLAQAGHNYAIYDEFGPRGMRMRVGFPVSARFDDTAVIRCFSMGPAVAAHTKWPARRAARSGPRFAASHCGQTTWVLSAILPLLLASLRRRPPSAGRFTAELHGIGLHARQGLRREDIGLREPKSEFRFTKRERCANGLSSHMDSRMPVCYPHDCSAVSWARWLQGCTVF